jgi:PAS domain S-box-containing protein
MQGSAGILTTFKEDTNGYAYIITSGVVQKAKKGADVILAEQVLNSARMDELHGNYTKKFVYLYKRDGNVYIVAASPTIIQNPELQSQIKTIVRDMRPDSKGRIIGTLRTSNEGEFEGLFEPSKIDSNLYVGILVPQKTVQTTIMKIVFGALTFLLFICIGIMFIYSAIIRKITSSIEILTTISKKMASGDLNQQVYINTKDEIGALSSSFNQMIRNLRDSSINLIKEKAQSEAIVTSIPDGLIVTDLHNRILLANQKAEEILEFDLEEARGGLVGAFINNKTLIESLDEVVKEQKPVINRELIIETTESKKKIYTINCNTVRDEQDYILGMITVLRDVTRDRELEALRDSFLHTVSHELRTPLTSIIGFIELVKGPKLSEDQDAYLQIALDEAMNLKNLIDDLLDLSRIEAGKITLFYSQINCKEMIDHLITSLSPLVKGKPVTLSSKFTQDNLIIEGDLPKMRRVLLNLISNAIKFTHEGTITVDCQLKDGFVIFSVEDTGVGLPEEEKAVIFEKFRQLDYSSTRQYEGIGLGLSIVRQLVELHNGKTWVESVYGKGSTFYFKIPIKQV